MKVTFIGHAATLIETNGIRILSDPWWQGPCFGTQWYVHPEPWLDPVNERAPDFIYVSHGHSDHLHPGTLRRLPKSAKVLVSDAIDIGQTIADMGFEVIALGPRAVEEIAPGVRVEVTPTVGGDTIMVVDDGRETCLNLNDAVHATSAAFQAEFLRELSGRYADPTYVFCGYGTASHFPNCYFIPGKDNAQTASTRQSHFNRIWASIIARLAPRYGFPFAADVIFLEDDLFWSNEPVHNNERPTTVFRNLYPSSRTTVYDIAPGFVIENGTVIRDARFEPVSNDGIAATRQADIRQANTVTVPSREDIESLAALLRRNVDIALPYLREYRDDYRFLVALRGTDTGIEITKSGPAITVTTVNGPANPDRHDVVFTTRFSYLRRTLTTEYGHEVIFVGSGGTFSYRDRSTAAANLHRELVAVLRKIETAPPSRYGDQPYWKFALKQRIKRFLGRESADLYDLDTWTVFMDNAR